MAKWEEREIPASDKALRSLYMPASYTKNLKGKGKKIRWKKQEKIKPKGEHSVSHDLDTEYTYKKSSGKKSKSGTPTYAGSKTQRLRPSNKDDFGEDVTSKVVDEHQSLKTKGGGYDTVRLKKKSLDVKSPIRSGGRAYKKKEITQEIQDKKGKIKEKHDLIKNKKKLKEVLLAGVEKEKADNIAKQVRAGYGGEWLKDMDLEKGINKKKNRKISSVSELR